MSSKTLGQGAAPSKTEIDVTIKGKTAEALAEVAKERSVSLEVLLFLMLRSEFKTWGLGGDGQPLRTEPTDFDARTEGDLRPGDLAITSTDDLVLILDVNDPKALCTLSWVRVNGLLRSESDEDAFELSMAQLRRAKPPRG